ncbi:hypothetical protein NBRC111894_4248 [Sporolactobacillus inulinus]|uniref:Uncharacterized protein n=1 Tax=Sporolactobacillus inulinus TaxID=2078 RepID=A0A4Y1ZIE0_9BACL|nr:hypothetical protein [Sporolactobacillus inulinus]GAY78694.1 hypothetical protein NBRC111894_4248 [Sporolactobacillus inulinus]
MNWIDEQQSEFKTKNCIPIILGIKIYDKSFKIYYQALEDFFSLIPTIMNIKKGTWVKEKGSS